LGQEGKKSIAGEKKLKFESTSFPKKEQLKHACREEKKCENKNPVYGFWGFGPVDTILQCSCLGKGDFFWWDKGES